MTADSIRHGCTMPATRRGFTLVEILIVVVILGILAGIIIPRFTDASVQSKTNALKEDLRRLRQQIALYAAEHRDVPPGYPGGSPAATPTEADFLQQMTLHTDENGNPSATASGIYRFGPYFQAMPANPLNADSAVYVVANGADLPEPGTVAGGWIYKPQTLELIPNLAGTDVDGKAYSDY